MRRQPTLSHAHIWPRTVTVSPVDRLRSRPRTCSARARWIAPTCRHRVLTFALTACRAFFGGVGVDVVPVGAWLSVALDTPAEEVLTLVDVCDQGLFLGQA